METDVMTEEEGDNDLRCLAAGTSIESSRWPLILDRIVSRIQNTCRHDFPIPRLPARPDLPPSIKDAQGNNLHHIRQSPDASDRPAKKPKLESDAVSPIGSQSSDVQARNAVHSDAYSETRSPMANNDEDEDETEKSQLPPSLHLVLQNILRTLRENFTSAPPHTAQRLAELILHPKSHYKTLPSYIRALDRVSCVVSTTVIYPLHGGSHPHQQRGARDGDSTPALFAARTAADVIGQEDRDFIGGAELIPIPWLRDEAVSPSAATVTSPSSAEVRGRSPLKDLHTESTDVIEGPNGVGSIETVSVNKTQIHKASSDVHATARSHLSPGPSPTEQRSLTSLSEQLLSNEGYPQDPDDEIYTDHDDEEADANIDVDADAEAEIDTEPPHTPVSTTRADNVLTNDPQSNPS